MTVINTTLRTTFMNGLWAKMYLQFEERLLKEDMIKEKLKSRLSQIEMLKYI